MKKKMVVYMDSLSISWDKIFKKFQTSLAYERLKFLQNLPQP